MDCPGCHAPVSDRNKFCMECGNPLSRQCYSCGSLLPLAAKFCPECGASLALATQPPAPTRLEQAAVAPVATAERRQITVLFCDLVGSTALAAALDPEDLREVIAEYQNCAAVAVSEYGGFVAKYLGDGILVYFGWPHADEADPERAVRAARSVLDAVARMSSSLAPLTVRIGLASGLAVVGDLLGDGAAREQTVVGETPNLAARLQAIAEPGGVVIDAETHRRIGGLFECQEIRGIDLRGFPRPVQAWRVVGEAAIQSRFEAMHPSALTPLVGRDDDLDLLHRRWRQARVGEGQVVLISGEPGIGKSRLIAALEEHVVGDQHTTLKYFCSPHHRDSALQPIIARWEAEAGIRTGEAADSRLEKLEALLLPLGATPEEVALVADMLGISCGERFPSLYVSPQRRKERTFEVLSRLLGVRASRTPVLMLFEDAHWADPSSLELLDKVITRMSGLRVLLIISYRSEFRVPWVGQSGVSLIALSRLSARQSAALAGQLVVGESLPTGILERIVAQADGVPLFIEELTKTVLQGSSHVDPAAVRVPGTLQASLMARLDRLPAAKQVSQIAAVIGREFSHDVISAVAALPNAALDDGLDELVNAGLVFRRGTPPEAIYVFKHALVQDAAYSTLLRKQRQVLHSRVAAVLREQVSDRGAAEPELLAHHCSEAGLAEEAVGWWHRAGERAIDRSASVEAIAHLSRGLKLLEHLPATADRQREELALRMAIAGPLLVTKGYAAPDVEQTCLRAQQLCEELGRSDELFPAIRGLWHCFFTRGELDRARELAERLVTIAEGQHQALPRAIGYRALGSTLFCRGEFVEAAKWLREGLSFDELTAGSDDRHTQFLLYADRPGIGGRLYLAWCEWHLGSPDCATETIEATIALSRRLSHAPPVAFALSYGAVVHQWAKNFDVAQQLAEAAMALSRENSLAQWLAFSTMCRGTAIAHQGRYEEGLADLRAGHSAWHQIGARLLDSMWFGFAAGAHAAAGEMEAASISLEQAMQVTAATGELFYKGELNRLKAELLAIPGSRPAADASLDSSSVSSLRPSTGRT